MTSLFASLTDTSVEEDTKNPLYDYSKHLTELPPSSSAFPYWFSFSNPAPPVRQIYLTLAIQTQPLPPEIIVELSPEEVEAKRRAEQASKVVITAEALESKQKVKDDDRSVGSNHEEGRVTEEEQERLEKLKNPNALTLNERFQLLDRRMWSQMICFDGKL